MKVAMIIMMIIMVILMVIMTKMTKNIQLLWSLSKNCYFKDWYLAKKRGPKIRTWVAPPLIRAMPERKRFFSIDVFPYWCCTLLLLTDISSAWEMERRLNKLGLFDRPAVKKAVQLKTLCGWIMFVPNVSHHGQSFKLSSSHSECSTCDGQALVPEGSSPPRPPCRPGDNDALMTIVMWQYDGHHIPSSLHMLLKKVDSSI